MFISIYLNDYFIDKCIDTSKLLRKIYFWFWQHPNISTDFRMSSITCKEPQLLRHSKLPCRDTGHRQKKVAIVSILYSRIVEQRTEATQLWNILFTALITFFKWKISFHLRLHKSWQITINNFCIFKEISTSFIRKHATLKTIKFT